MNIGGVETQELIKQQIKVEVVNGSDGMVKIILPNKQSFNWPVAGNNLTSGQFYITLSKESQLPDKQELAKLVLKEILQNGQ